MTWKTQSKFWQRAEEFGVGGIAVCLPTTIKWQHRGAPLTFRRKSGRVQEELEFKRSSNMIHWGAACSYSRQRAKESSEFNEAHCGVPSRERPYEIVMYLYVCVFDVWYLRVRVSLRSHMTRNVASNWTPTLYNAIQTRIISKLITTQSSSPYKVRLIVQNSHVVTCVQILHAWKPGDFMNRLD